MRALALFAPLAVALVDLGDQGCQADASQDGAVMDQSPGGRPGCCNAGSVSFAVNCTQSGDESARIFVRLDQAPPDLCVDYAVVYSDLAE